MAKRKIHLPEGLRLGAPSRMGHLPVLWDDGTPLRMPGGMPVKVAMSPSDWRTVKNEQTRIKKAVAHGREAP